MIIIIRALSQKEKRGNAKTKAKKGKAKKKKGPKNERKERSDNATILLPHLFFKVAP